MTAQRVLDLFRLIVKRRVATKYVLLRAIKFHLQDSLPNGVLTRFYEPEDLLKLSAEEIPLAGAYLRPLLDEQPVEVTAAHAFCLLKDKAAS